MGNFLEKAKTWLSGDNKPLKSGAYYVNYPEYNVLSSESSADGGSGGRAKLGHAGVLLVDNNGGTRYYEYGRYNNTNVGEQVKESDGTSGGNWRKVTVPDNATMSQMSQHLLSKQGGHAGNTVRLTHVPVDYDKVLSYITQDANNKNRDEYQVCGYNDKNCGSQASAAIQAGTPWYADAIRGLVSGIHRASKMITGPISGIAEGAITTRGKNNTDFVGPLAAFSGRDTPQDYEDLYITRSTYNYTK